MSKATRTVRVRKDGDASSRAEVLFPLASQLIGVTSAEEVVRTTLETLGATYPGTVWRLYMLTLSGVPLQGNLSARGEVSIDRVSASAMKDPQELMRPRGFGETWEWVTYPCEKEDQRDPVMLLGVSAIPGWTAPGTDELHTISALVAAAMAAAWECERLRHANGRDGMTDLLNRRAIEGVLEAERERAKRYGRHLAVLFVDLDCFKEINDHYGHRVGDLALKSVARALTDTVREVDVVGRYGGDEFVVVLPDTTDADARNVVRRIECNIAREGVSAGDITLMLQVSIGIASVDEHHDDLIGLADQRMLALKRRKRRPQPAHTDQPALIVS